jgi:hypothetical protein
MKTMTFIPATDEEFKAEYILALKSLMTAKAKTYGVQVWAERAALLYDARPEFCDAIEEAV